MALDSGYWVEAGSFEVHSQNTDVKGNSGEGSERKRENWRKTFHFLRECMRNHEHNAGRNKDGKVHLVRRSLL